MSELYSSTWKAGKERHCRLKAKFDGVVFYIKQNVVKVKASRIRHTCGIGFENALGLVNKTGIQV